MNPSEPEYRGYIINPVPDRLSTGKWTTNVRISKHRDDGVTERSFSASNEFETEVDAEEGSIDFGKKIIDGEFPGLTVQDI